MDIVEDFLKRKVYPYYKAKIRTKFNKRLGILDNADDEAGELLIDDERMAG